MPVMRKCEKTGAIIFDPTPEEKMDVTIDTLVFQIQELTKRVEELETKLGKG